MFTYLVQKKWRQFFYEFLKSRENSEVLNSDRGSDINLYVKLMKIIVETKFMNKSNVSEYQINEDFLQVLAQSYLFEPANYISPGSENQVLTKYIHGVPPKENSTICMKRLY